MHETVARARFQKTNVRKIKRRSEQRGIVHCQRCANEELGCRSYRRASWEAAQSRVGEEVARISGCSEKKSLIEEVCQ